METYKLKYPNLIKFLLGGKADFILHNLKSGNHINFTIIKKKFKKTIQNSNPKEYFAVSYILNKKEYYIGMINTIPCNNYIQSQTLEEEDYKYNEIFQNLFVFLFIKGKMPNGIEILYTGKCSICNRKLTDPESIKIGIGEFCLKHYT